MQIDSRLWELTLRGHSYPLWVPAQPEEKYQAAWDRYGQDDAYFPFWLEVWKSSVVLFDFLEQTQVQWPEVGLEIGGGSGVLAQLLGQRYSQQNLVHSDLVPDACVYAASKVHGAQQKWVAMDMKHSCFRKPFEIIMASDLCYEDRLVHLVLDAVPQLLAENGVLYLSDPHRYHRLSRTREILAQSKLSIHTIPWQTPFDGDTMVADIHCIRRS